MALLGRNKLLVKVALQGNVSLLRMVVMFEECDSLWSVVFLGGMAQY